MRIGTSRVRPGPKSATQTRAPKGIRFAPPAIHVSISLSAVVRVALCASVVTPAAADAQVFTSLVASPDSTTASEIRQVRDEYVSAVNAREAEQIALLYTDDAVVIPSEGVFLRGKAEITRYFVDTLGGAHGADVVMMTPLAVTTGGTLGSESGSFEESRTTPAGTRVHVTGLYVIIYSRGADDRWRIVMEVRTRGDSLVSSSTGNQDPPRGKLRGDLQ